MHGIVTRLWYPSSHVVLSRITQHKHYFYIIRRCQRGWYRCLLNYYLPDWELHSCDNSVWYITLPTMARVTCIAWYDLSRKLYLMRTMRSIWTYTCCLNESKNCWLTRQWILTPFDIRSVCMILWIWSYSLLFRIKYSSCVMTIYCICKLIQILESRKGLINIANLTKSLCFLVKFYVYW